MSRINTNVPSLIAQRVLNRQNDGLVTSLERLSTGLRINRGKDNPAGLIASENLRAEKSAINAAIGNAQRAEQVVNVAEGGLQEISNLLVELQGLIGQTASEAGTSAEEKQANQQQIDSILSSIDRLANSTSFQGTKLLNGNFDYTTSAVSVNFDKVTINAARLSEATGSYLTVAVEVQASAQTGAVFLSTGATLVNGGNGSITFEISGTEGVQQFSFASGTTQANIITAINTFADALGVSASDAGSGRVGVNSRVFGSESFVRARIQEGTSTGLIFAAATGGTGGLNLQDFGKDAQVTINGNLVTANGLSARIATDSLDVSVDIIGTSALNTNGGTTSFYITGGGANFNLSPRVSLAGKVSLGVEAVTTGNLGNSTAGNLSAIRSGGTANVVNGDLTKAQNIVSAAIKQLTGLRGRLGSFQSNVVASTINNLGVSLENTAAAESSIRDTDFAAETATLTRQQILVQAATQALSLANAQPSRVLALLGQ